MTRMWSTCWFAPKVKGGGGGVQQQRLRRQSCNNSSGDMCEVVAHVGTRYPKANLYAIGWSVGANILVRYLGQTRTSIMALIMFMTKLLQVHSAKFSISMLYSLFEDIGGEYNIPLAANAKSVREFDDGLTRVSFGFKSVDDYCSNSSSSNSIKDVCTLLLCIQAENDLIAPNQGIPREDIKDNPNCMLIVTPKGSHLG